MKIYVYIRGDDSAGIPDMKDIIESNIDISELGDRGYVREVIAECWEDIYGQRDIGVVFEDDIEEDDER